MQVICPTVTAQNSHQYREQIERVQPFSKRIHLDFADGVLAPKLIDLRQAWLPKVMMADLHLMYRIPTEIIDEAIDLKPNLIILQAEAEGNFTELAEKLHKNSIKTGLALLADTPVAKIESAIEAIDHVLVFSGNLGHFGGQADLSLLVKVKQLMQLKNSLEIGWDGGVNEQNIEKLKTGGIDVFNVGGYIQHAESPEKAYAKLEAAIN